MSTLSVKLDGTLLDRAADVKVLGAHNGARVVSFRIRTDGFLHPASLEEYVGKVRAYLDDELIAHCWITDANHSGDRAGTYAEVVAADPLTAMIARRVRQGEDSYGRTAADRRTWTSVDQGEWVMQLIDDENTRGYTGLRTRARDYATGVIRTITLEQDKPTLQAIAEVATGYNGFDYGVIPVDDEYMGDLAVWTRRGSQRKARYEFQTGKNNIESWRVLNDSSKLTTRQILTAGNGTRVVVDNPEAQAYYGTVLDSVDSISDVSDPTLAQIIAYRLGQWRSRPRQTLALKPAATSRYLPTVDFDEGDEIHVRIDAGALSGDRAIDGYVRVYGWSLTRGIGGAAKLEQIDISPNDQGSV